MKRFRIVLSAMLTLLCVHTASAANEIYAAFNSDQKTLTIYYDDLRANREGVTAWVAYRKGTAGMSKAERERVEKVVIDETMQKARPTSLCQWFEGLINMTEIEHLDYLNTSAATDMQYTFNMCKSLQSVDVSHFDTRQVEYMTYMFADCSTLTVIDIRNFVMTNVVSTLAMFANCTSLYSIYYHGDFMKDAKLTAPMSHYYMFGNCPKLRGEYHAGWLDSHVDGTSAHIAFDESDYFGYFSVKGSEESELYATYNSATKTLTLHYDRGRIDLYSIAHGTAENDLNWQSEEAGYCREAEKIRIDLSVRNYYHPTSTEKLFYNFSLVEEIENLQYLNTSEVTSMRSMFEGCSSLTTLDLSQFNTSNVTDMTGMFSGCNELQSLDLSSFDTRNVTKMKDMFSSCLKLKSLDLDHFDTRQVTSMENMFRQCKALKSLDLTFINMQNVQNVDNIFYDCSELTTIYCNKDWSQLPNMTSKKNLFLLSTKLKGGNGTIYDESNVKISYAHPDKPGNPGYFSSRAESENDELYGVLRDDDKTLVIYYDKYKPLRENVSAWSPDGGTNAMDPALRSAITRVEFNFSVADATPSRTNSWFYNMASLTKVAGINYLNTSNVTDMGSMFYGCQHLEAVDLTGFNTSKVTTTSYMFRSCSSLEKLDLRSFNIQNIINAISMFDGCSALKTIYCDDDWSKSTRMKRSTGMFNDCTNLKGGNGTTFISSKIDNSYARPDKAGSAGYFTSAFKVTLISENGKITIEEGELNLNAVNVGTTIHLTATPDEGYEFVRWENYNPETGLTVTADMVITAVFRIIPNYYYVTFKNHEGAILLNKKIEEGMMTTCPESAPEREGYEFIGWLSSQTNEILSSEQIEALNVYGNVSYTAQYKLKTFTVTLGEQVSASKSGTLEYGTEIIISAIPPANKYFVQWSDGKTDNPRTEVVSSDITYSAVFALYRYQITVASENEAYGTVSGGGEFDFGTDIQLEATPQTGYRFKIWSDGNISNPRTVTVTQEKTYTAQFEKEIETFTCMLQSEDETMGLVTGGGTFASGTELKLYAVSKRGYQFKQWNNGSTDNPLIYIVTENTSYSAQFETISLSPKTTYTVSLSAAPSEGGTLLGEGQYEDGSVIVIAALPASGYEFVEWNDGVTDAARLLTVNENINMMANFRPKEGMTGIEEPSFLPLSQGMKIIQNGVIYFIYNGQLFDMNGQKVK